MEVNGYQIRPEEDLSEAELEGAQLANADLSGARLCKYHATWLCHQIHPHLFFSDSGGGGSCPNGW